METIEGNKIIAEFMGYKYSHIDPCWKNEIYANDKRTFAIGEMEYHSSWDWLMPVVEKISSLSFNESNNRFQPEATRFLENDIEGIWFEVAQFIQWYNNNKPPVHKYKEVGY